MNGSDHNLPFMLLRVKTGLFFGVTRQAVFIGGHRAHFFGELRQSPIRVNPGGAFKHQGQLVSQRQFSRCLEKILCYRQHQLIDGQQHGRLPAL